MPGGVAIPPLQCPTVEQRKSPQWGSKKNKFLAEKTGSPHQNLPMPSPLPSPSGNSGCSLRFASPIAGRGCWRMGGNNMPLHAPAEFPASLGRGMSACLEVWFEKNRRARAPREPPGHRRSLGHRRKGQSNRARRGGVMSVPEVCGSGERRGRGENGGQGREGKRGNRADERSRVGKRGENRAEQGEELGARERWKTGQRRQERDGKKGENRAKHRRGAG